VTGRPPSLDDCAMNLHAIGWSSLGVKPSGYMLEIVVAFLIGSALGFGVGYGVREQRSRKRHRRLREQNGY
jgi:hypothetical protein